MRRRTAGFDSLERGACTLRARNLSSLPRRLKGIVKAILPLHRPCYRIYRMSLFGHIAAPVHQAPTTMALPVSGRRSLSVRLKRTLFFMAVRVMPLATVWLASPAFSAAPGSGATFDESNVNYDPGPVERRGGFTIGLTQALGYGVYQGYPLEVAALDDPDEKQTTGPALATQFQVWMGATMRDFLTFGVGFSAMSTQGRQIGANAALLIHLEAYPLYFKGGTFRDLGLSFDGGLGLGVILERDKGKAGDTVAEGGALSTMGLGAFWAPLRFWHFSVGPTLNYVYGFSQTMHAHQGTLGVRFVFFAKQPKESKGAGSETALVNW